jgi:hypothetical protein
MAAQSLQIKRNKEIFTTKEEAVNHLRSLVEKLDDGEIVLCRYFNDETIETLVGFETKRIEINEKGNEVEKSSIAYVDTFNELGKGLSYDDKHILNVNVGDGLTIDNDNNITLNLSNGLQITNKQLAVKLNEQNKIIENQNTSQKMKNRFHKKRKSQKIALSQRQTNTNDSTDTVPELPEVYV